MKKSLEKPAGCSFFYIDKCGKDNKPLCNEKSKWQGPGGGKNKYYTTWSYYAIILASIIVVPFYFLAKFTNLANSKLFIFIMLSLLIGIAINSIAVGVTSQCLVAEWKPVSGKEDEESLIREKWVEWFTKTNIRAHLVPVLLSILILIIITKIPYNFTSNNLIMSSILVPVIYFFIWDITPIPIKENSKQTTNIFNKPKYVYNNPSFYVEMTLPLTVILLTIMYIKLCKQ
jgi:hypothetical protein